MEHQLKIFLTILDEMTEKLEKELDPENDCIGVCLQHSDLILKSLEEIILIINNKDRFCLSLVIVVECPFIQQCSEK